MRRQSAGRGGGPPRGTRCAACASSALRGATRSVVFGFDDRQKQRSHGEGPRPARRREPVNFCLGTLDATLVIWSDPLAGSGGAGAPTTDRSQGEPSARGPPQERALGRAVAPGPTELPREPRAVDGTMGVSDRKRAIGPNQDKGDSRWLRRMSFSILVASNPPKKIWTPGQRALLTRRGTNFHSKRFLIQHQQVPMMSTR